MDELIKIRYATLQDLPADIQRPNYTPDQLTPGIVHVGIGNFHRAHQAWYLHRLMQQNRAFDWAIVGSGVRVGYDTKMRQRLLEQDCLTTLVELDPEGVTAEVIGSMVDYIPVEKGNHALIQMMIDPNIRIVSLTVTEGGYYIDPVSGAFDTNHPEIRFDSENPARPNTVFGAIVAALKQRRERDQIPFTVLSCDNLMSNGAVTRQAVITLAGMSDPALAEWIAENCCFPNSMVDCIVPATGEKELSLARELGIRDEVPVTHENFRQWVIEDNFCAGRPDWHLVGVTFTDSVRAYEAMKLRILNAGHQIVANAGEILSLETIAEAMADKSIAALFRKVQINEIVPCVAAVPDIEPKQYVDLVEERFRNQAIVDTTRRVAFDGATRHTGFILPIINERIAVGGSTEGLALVEALWARMCTGIREDGSLIEPNDPEWDQLRSVAIAARENPVVWLEQTQIYGVLGKNTAFRNSFDYWLTMIWEQGVRATINSYVYEMDLRTDWSEEQPALRR